MDFHTLSRRDLQALCKKNKIPANITNLAMADALQSLPNVEGLEELLMNPGTDCPETPAKSMTATPSVARTSQLTTRARRTTRKAEGETDQAKNDIPKAAPSSAFGKPSIARSTTQRNVESSTAARVYTTRRSTRLLEKQMDQLSLKDNEDMVASANANLEKDSQDMQRQFSEDMDNSDELNVTKEASDEPDSVEDVLLENEKSFSVGTKTDEPVNMDDALDLEKECNQVEESIEDIEGFKNEEGEPMQEDVAEQIEMVSHPEFESQSTLNGVEDAVSQPITENTIAVEEIPITKNAIAVEEISISSVVVPDETLMVIEEEVIIVNGEETLGSEAGGDNSAVDPQTTKLEENAVQLKASEFSDGEFDFLSESDDNDSDNNQEVDQLVENGDMVDGFGNTKEESSRKSSVEREVHITDNKENFQMKPVLAALKNASSAARTPIEKKSLRQLKKMVKELSKKQQQPQPAAEEKQAALHV